MDVMLGAKGYAVSYWRVAAKHLALGSKDVALNTWRLALGR